MSKPPVDKHSLPYRPCVGVMLLNAQGQVFVGQRIDRIGNEAWQMPQGGIDPGEEEQATALRELGEETGIAPHHVEIVARADRLLYYDLPDELVGKIWGGRYRGQVQRWFLMRFIGRDEDVDIATAHPEFGAWLWAPPSRLVELIVPFKKQLYADVIAEFADYLT